ncbi:M24 family metallopeptidase [Haloplanus natans]|uniref:M24 family metallopeptidase n=1 Tax=Haloplanus natans TaxID=376171 RepID=UPI000677BB9A|nr:M24 family metallopeptidase [Haloplanus natans]
MSSEAALAAAERGLVAAATRLAEATVVDDRLHVGDPLTPSVLERVASAAAGDDATVTVETRAGVLPPDDPVVVAVDPADAAPLARTFVVDGAGGWTRRAAVAVGMAHDAVRRVVEPGVPARRVVDEAVAELGAYGLATADGPVAHGIGTSIDFSGDTPLDAGTRFALDPAARDPDPDTDRGRVRIGGWYVVTDDGCRVSSDLPTSLSPAAYSG